MKARPTQSRKGVKGGLRPFSSVPCGVWGNAPTVSRATSISNALNKGAGSEASLPLTLRVRRRAPKLLFPQDSVKNLFFGIRRFVSGIRKRADFFNQLFARCHPDLNWRMKVLQTFALPLGYGTIIRNGAVDGARTRDLHLGKVALYQLSYYRIICVPWGGIEPPTRRFSVCCSTD